MALSSRQRHKEEPLPTFADYNLDVELTSNRAVQVSNSSIPIDPSSRAIQGLHSLSHIPPGHDLAAEVVNGSN
jgi:hypothetical protein